MVGRMVKFLSGLYKRLANRRKEALANALQSKLEEDSYAVRDYWLSISRERASVIAYIRANISKNRLEELRGLSYFVHKSLISYYTGEGNVLSLSLAAPNSVLIIKPGEKAAPYKLSVEYKSGYVTTLDINDWEELIAAISYYSDKDLFIFPDWSLANIID